jgi:DNA-binding MarR family transcriptional regulator
MSSQDAATLFALNTRLSVELLAEATPAVEALGLEPKAFFVLDGLEQQPYPAELATRLSMPRPTITGYLKTLEARGFIRRDLDAQDLRRHRLALTPHGQSVLANARDILAACYSDRLDRLDAFERATFAALLKKLTS